MQSLSSIVSNVSNFLPWNATRVPEGVKPVENFDISRFDNKWYEIARLDTPFEKKLGNVSATYDIRDDGGINVLNKGINETSGKAVEIKGKAYFVGDSDKAHLKVSFFGPFYASYVVMGLDRGEGTDKYQNALITGNSKDFLWLLSRDPSVSDAVKNEFVQQAKDLGYKTDALVWVDQSQNQAGGGTAQSARSEAVETPAASVPFKGALSPA